MEAALLAPVLLDALDDLVALLPQAVHLDDLLRRVLEVAVDDDNTVALCALKPGEHRRLLAEVAAEMQTDDMGVLFGGGRNFGPGFVRRTVVHKKQLILNARAAENVRKAGGGNMNHFFFVIGRENYRKHTLASL